MRPYERRTGYDADILVGYQAYRSKIVRRLGMAPAT